MNKQESAVHGNGYHPRNGCYLATKARVHRQVAGYHNGVDDHNYYKIGHTSDDMESWANGLTFDHVFHIVLQKNRCCILLTQSTEVVEVQIVDTVMYNDCDCQPNITFDRVRNQHLP